MQSREPESSSGATQQHFDTPSHMAAVVLSPSSSSDAFSFILSLRTRSHDTSHLTMAWEFSSEFPLKFLSLKTEIEKLIFKINPRGESFTSGSKWAVSSFHLFAVAVGGSRGGRRKGGGIGEARRGKNFRQGELGVRSSFLRWPGSVCVSLSS